MVRVFSLHIPLYERGIQGDFPRDYQSPLPLLKREYMVAIFILNAQ